MGGSPSAHLPVRKAKPTSIPSLFCSVSRLCGVAVSQTISPSEPRPVRSPNWERETDEGWALPHLGGAGLGVPPVALQRPLTWKRWVTTLMYAPAAATNMQMAKLP